VLVVVMTDGFENASTDYDARTVAELVRDYEQRPNWTFVYLGAGHDSIDDAQRAAIHMGYKADNAMHWAHDPASARKAMHSLAHATDARRRAAARKSEKFFDDAGQTDADYKHTDTGDSAAHPKPLSHRPKAPNQIHRRTLRDALRTSKRVDRGN
jgi:hypothetical protein